MKAVFPQRGANHRDAGIIVNEHRLGTAASQSIVTTVQLFPQKLSRLNRFFPCVCLGHVLTWSCSASMTLQEEVQMVTGTSRALRILIVDDEAGACDSTALLLKLWGFETVVARTREQALQAARLRSPDVVLLDLVVPEMKGLEIARCLRELRKRLFIVAISGHGDAQIRQRCQDAGIDLHCLKPFNPKILEKADCGTSP
jgi:CheY-like chemotaxis protein